MKDRMNFIDFLRGLAVIFMIEVHIYYYWINWTKVDYGVFTDIIFLIGAYAAPCFICVSGMSFSLYILKKKVENFSKKQIFIDNLKRASFIFVIPTLLKFLFGMYFKLNEDVLLYWSVFQVISISMICFFFFPFLDHIRKTTIAFFSIMISVVLLYLLINIFQVKFLMFLVDDTFEFLPWTTFFVFGLLIGKVLKKGVNIKLKNLLSFLSFGFILFIFGLYDFIINREIEDKRIEFFILIYGGLIILVISSFLIFDIKNITFNFIDRLKKWGRFAFSIYYIQYFFIALGNSLFFFLLNDVYSNGFNIFHFIILFFIFLFLIESILIIWEKFNFILSLEWIMNKFSERSAFQSSKK